MIPQASTSNDNVVANFKKKNLKRNAGSRCCAFFVSSATWPKASYSVIAGYRARGDEAGKFPHLVSLMD